MGKEKLTADEVRLVKDIILLHHKIFPFNGADKDDTAIVNAVRKGDWIDATTCYSGGSFVRKGVRSADIVAAHAAIPEMGFGKFLGSIMPWGAYAAKLNPDSSMKRFGAFSIF